MESECSRSLSNLFIHWGEEVTALAVQTYERISRYTYTNW